MDIFFAVNDAYAKQLCVCIVSILENNKNQNIHFHVLSRDFSEKSKKYVQNLRKKYKNWDISYHVPDEKLFSHLKLNIDYITIETYFRYIIADLAPNLDKCLYLDADLIVNGSLSGLWNTPLEDCYCAGAKDLFIERSGYKKDIQFGEGDLYANAGVLLFNLAKIRQDGMVEKLFENTEKLADKIVYQDQDIINITFKGRIKEADSIYNFTAENVKREKNKRKKAVIIHYTGKKKPWNDDCKNKLAPLWHKYAKLNDEAQNKKIKVGLLIDEFFGGAGTAFGGYGFLARKYIAKYIPNKDIQIDVLLGKGKRKFWAQHFHEDDVDLYRLPRNKHMAQRWLKKQNYDIYLSIELTTDFVLKHETDPNKKLILWIQDPRPQYEWDEINTVKLFPESCYYNQKIYDLVHEWDLQKRVSFISQGYFLNSKAIDLYNLDKNVPIQYLPNPVDIDFSFDASSFPKKDKIIFLGRIESVKRGWLFCEIAKRMPEYDFYMLGQSFREKDKNSKIMGKYQDIPNLHFAGHVDGIEKETFLKEAKILVNTSIHEALPVSFLEALAYGTVLVSNRNPENLTSKFGIHVGDVLGDGFDKVDLYVNAVKELMTNDKRRKELALSAIKYIRDNHNVEKFTKDLRDVIFKELNI